MRLRILPGTAYAGTTYNIEILILLISVTHAPNIEGDKPVILYSTSVSLFRSKVRLRSLYSALRMDCYYDSVPLRRDLVSPAAASTLLVRSALCEDVKQYTTTL